MKLIKDYIDSAELMYIVNELSQIENNVAREIAKIGMLYQILVEDAPKLDDCNGYYDLYAKQNSIDFNDIRNVEMIDKLVNENVGTMAVVKSFLNDLNIKIDEAMTKLDGLNQEQILNQMKEIINHG